MSTGPKTPSTPLMNRMNAPLQQSNLRPRHESLRFSRTCQSRISVVRARNNCCPFQLWNVEPVPSRALYHGAIGGVKGFGKVRLRPTVPETPTDRSDVSELRRAAGDRADTDRCDCRALADCEKHRELDRLEPAW